MNRLEFHGPISQVNFPYSSSSSENILRSSCRLRLEMDYKIIIRSFLISSSKMIGRLWLRGPQFLLQGSLEHKPVSPAVVVRNASI